MQVAKRQKMETKVKGTTTPTPPSTSSSGDIDAIIAKRFKVGKSVKSSSGLGKISSGEASCQALVLTASEKSGTTNGFQWNVVRLSVCPLESGSVSTEHFGPKSKKITLKRPDTTFEKGVVISPSTLAGDVKAGEFCTGDVVSIYDLHYSAYPAAKDDEDTLIKAGDLSVSYSCKKISKESPQERLKKFEMVEAKLNSKEQLKVFAQTMEEERIRRKKMIDEVRALQLKEKAVLDAQDAKRAGGQAMALGFNTLDQGLSTSSLGVQAEGKPAAAATTTTTTTEEEEKMKLELLEVRAELARYSTPDRCPDEWLLTINPPQRLISWDFNNNMFTCRFPSPSSLHMTRKEVPEGLDGLWYEKQDLSKQHPCIGYSGNSKNKEPSPFTTTVYDPLDPQDRAYNLDLTNRYSSPDEAQKFRTVTKETWLHLGPCFISGLACTMHAVVDCIRSNPNADGGAQASFQADCYMEVDYPTTMEQTGWELTLDQVKTRFKLDSLKEALPGDENQFIKWGQNDFINLNEHNGKLETFNEETYKFYLLSQKRNIAMSEGKSREKAWERSVVNLGKLMERQGLLKEEQLPRMKEQGVKEITDKYPERRVDWLLLQTELKRLFNTKATPEQKAAILEELLKEEDCVECIYAVKRTV